MSRVEVQAAAAQDAINHCQDADPQNGISMRWFLPEAPSVTPDHSGRAPNSRAKPVSVYDSATDSFPGHRNAILQQQYSTREMLDIDQDLLPASCIVAASAQTKRHWRLGTRTQISISCMLLSLYFVLLKLGY